MAKQITKAQARRKFNKLQRDIRLALIYAQTTPEYGDDPWEALQEIEYTLRHKKRILQELRGFFFPKKDTKLSRKKETRL